MALIPDKPSIPYSTAIPGGLRPHTWVKIQGLVPETSTGFRVKFIYGQYEGANVALLFNPRFEGSPHIIFNSLVERKWGQEERKENIPLRKGKSFTLRFTTTTKAYEVTLNEHHRYEFRHRLPPDRVRFLEVDGDVKLEAVSWEGGGSYWNRFPPVPRWGASRVY
ncbi:unnamed protein product [Eretmochelys imbricata]